MTTALAVTCGDGLVVGTDMKAVAGFELQKKWVEHKILKQYTLAEHPLIIAGAGAIRHIRDAVQWLNLDALNEGLSGNVPPFDQLLETVEKQIPKFCQDYTSKYGEQAQIQLILAYMDDKHIPHLVEVYPGGEYDHKDNFAAVGSGSIFGEILLRRLHRADMSIQTAKRLVGYIIWEIQDIDNYTGENMQIVCLDKGDKVEEVDELDIQSYKSLPKLVDVSYEHLRRRIENVDLQEIRQHFANFDKILNSTKEHKPKQNSESTVKGEVHGKTNDPTMRRHKGTKERGNRSKDSTQASNKS